MCASNRKAGYKLPPTTIRDKLISQEARRAKALEEQKRRRANKIDSSRQLDFADLSLAEHSEDENQVEDQEDAPEFRLASASVAAYVLLLQAGDANDTMEMQPQTEAPLFAREGEDELERSMPIELSTAVASEPKKIRKRGGKNSHKRRSEANKASSSNKYKAGSSRWADKCMYAELLEMNADIIWDPVGNEGNDGLPGDLEHGWVAVAPVPKGKRCLVVTQQSAGVAGVVPNTTLRSRLLGKSLLPRFPSPLPALTVLDCILDDNWRQNGILHVLDVVRWKGQDIADCEAGFRFWWRDTRLAELTQSHPPIFQFVAPSTPPSGITDGTLPPKQQTRYIFPYPTTFIPVPYHAYTTLIALETHIIPAARSVREVPIILPAPILTSQTSAAAENGEMEIESSPPSVEPLSAAVNVKTNALVYPDGLLLYVSEASYEPGTSPLSSWVPIQGYKEPVDGNSGPRSSTTPSGQGEGPLDLFHRLVKQRIVRTSGVQLVAVSSDSSATNGSCENGFADVTMEL